MTRKEILSEALDDLFGAGLADYQKTDEYLLARDTRHCLDKTREQLFSEDQNRLLEEWLFHFFSMADDQAKALYLRGMEDCLWLLHRGRVL